MAVEHGPGRKSVDYVEVCHLVGAAALRAGSILEAVERGDPPGPVCSAFLSDAQRLVDEATAGPLVLMHLQRVVCEPWQRAIVPAALREASVSWPDCRVCGDRVRPGTGSSTVQECADGSALWSADADPELIGQDRGSRLMIHDWCGRLLPTRFVWPPVSAEVPHRVGEEGEGDD